MTDWQDISTAPKADIPVSVFAEFDPNLILVWYDHDADPYHDGNGRLTDYAAWTEGGNFLDGKGMCIAKWFPQDWEAVDEYGGGYWLPAAWFTGENFETVVNPIFWMPLPAPPTPKGGA